jgi:hypothetical protein
VATIAWLELLRSGDALAGEATNAANAGQAGTVEPHWEAEAANAAEADSR